MTGFQKSSATTPLKFIANKTLVKLNSTVNPEDVFVLTRELVADEQWIGTMLNNTNTRAIYVEDIDSFTNEFDNLELAKAEFDSIQGKLANLNFEKQLHDLAALANLTDEDPHTEDSALKAKQEKPEYSKSGLTQFKDNNYKKEEVEAVMGPNLPPCKLSPDELTLMEKLMREGVESLIVKLKQL